MIERLEKDGNPLFYRRGPNAGIMDRAYIEWRSGNYVESVNGRSWVLTEVIIRKKRADKGTIEPALSRSHLNGQIIFPVLKKGDMGSIRNPSIQGVDEVKVFEKKPYFDHNGVEKWKGKVPFGDGSVSVDFTETKKILTLTVWPPAVTIGPDQLAAAKDLLMANARKSPLSCRFMAVGSSAPLSKGVRSNTPPPTPE